MDYLDIFKKFQKIPKGVLIDNPNELIRPGFSIGCTCIYFTRRTLKHLSEKGFEGNILALAIPIILEDPAVILKGKKRRFLLAKHFLIEEVEPCVVVTECIATDTFIIVTAFVTNEKYLKNFEILWRTGTSLS